MAHDVFVSFSFADQEFAELIVNKLSTEYGISCWICTRDIDGGKRYKRLIPEAIDESQVVVFLQSENALSSREIPKEIGMAFDAGKTIIPFRLDKAQLQGDLRYDLYGVEYIDATVPTIEQRIRDLASAILSALGKPLITHIAKSEAPKLKSTKIVCGEIFQGRNNVLEEINSAFQLRDLVFIQGMGGIGKSEIACQYWRANNEFYSTVIFARYENSLASLISDDRVFCIEGFSRKTKADGSVQSDTEYAIDKLEYIKKHSDAHTLIVIDNYDVTYDPLFEDLIKDIPYRIIITTRCEQERGKYYVIPVKELEDSDLKNVFIEYANPQKTFVEYDDPAFPELFQLTGRHTLTLELIAKYMDEKDIDDVKEMVSLLKSNNLKALSDSAKKDGYETIRNVFTLTHLSENEKSFMRCLAMMPPGGVNQKCFKKWCGDVFSSRSRLIDLSFVKVNNQSKTISLHPIIREVVINELTPNYDNCKEFIDRCVMIGEDYIPIMWTLTYEEKMARWGCYSSVLNYVGDINEHTYPIYTNISCMSNYVGTYMESISLLESILQFTRKHFGELSKETMLVYNRLGWKNANVQLYDEALQYYQIAADWFYENPAYDTRESQDVIRGCSDAYYNVYKKTQDPLDLKKAYEYCAKFEEYGRRMLIASVNENEIFKIRLRYQTACISRNYFKICIEEKKYKEAEKYLTMYKSAVDQFIFESGEPSDTDKAGYHRQCATFKKALGEIQDAIVNLEAAYSIYLKYFSDRNPRSLDVLVELIECYVVAENYDMVKQLVEQAYMVAEKVYTVGHPTLQKLSVMKSEYLKIT